MRGRRNGSRAPRTPRISLAGAAAALALAALPLATIPAAGQEEAAEPSGPDTHAPHGAASDALALGSLSLDAPDGELPPIPLVEEDRARVVDRPEEGIVEIVVGPVDLPAGLGHLRLPIQIVRLPVEGWLHGFSWEIRDAEGRRLPDKLLHHVDLLDPDARELFSPIARRVLAAGRETRPATLPRFLGYPLERGTRIMVTAMFANPTDADHEDAYLHVKLRLSRAEDRGVRPLEVYPFYVDVMEPVGPKSFPVPPGRSERSWEGSPAVPCRILGIGSHLHDHAVEIRFEDVTTGEVLWRAAPNAGPGGRVRSVPVGRLWRRGGVPLHPDHIYRATVVYENPLDRPAPQGGMGVVAGVVALPEGAEWPELDRGDPAYVADLMNTVRAPYTMEGHDHGGDADHGDDGEDGEAVGHGADEDHGAEPAGAEGPAPSGERRPAPGR